MKRLGLFWLILLLVIVAFYMEPVLFPPKLEVKENSDQQISNQMTTWKYQELKATGFSTISENRSISWKRILAKPMID